MLNGRTSTKELSKIFETFSRVECHNSSPLYEKLALEVSRDGEMLKLASNAAHGPVPNIFLAAVHYLLLTGKDNGLSIFYPDIASELEVEGEPYPFFHDFCMENSSEIKEILNSRYVQTNEVQRCSLLVPALNFVSSEMNGPLAIVEVGASAGLNLLFDQYCYDYSNGVTMGKENSKVRLNCELRGNISPPLGHGFPEVDYRAGIDLNPIDVNNEDDMNWLRALIWPEHATRRNILETAIQEARMHDLHLIKGDASQNLQNIISEVPENTGLCILSTFTLNQFPKEKRAQFINNLAQLSSQRPIYLVSIGYRDDFTLKYPEIHVTKFDGGISSGKRIAMCHPHGDWLKWLKT